MKAVIIIIAAASILFADKISYLAASSLQSYEKMSIEEYLKSPDESLNITIASLIVAKTIFTNITFGKYIQEVNRLASAVLKEVKSSNDPNIHIAALNTVLFLDNKHGYDKNDLLGQIISNHTLTGIIDRKKGVCTALPLLYICVAEKCGFPIYAVTAPQHSFARYWIPDYYGKGKNYQNNIEATGYGAFVPDVDYIDSLNIPKDSFKSGVYLRTLTKREYIHQQIAVIAAWFRIEKNDIEKSIQYIKLSLSGYANNVLLWRSLSIKYQRLLANELSDIEKLETRKHNLLLAMKITERNQASTKPVVTRSASMTLLEQEVNDSYNRNGNINSPSIADHALNVELQQHIRKAKEYHEQYEYAKDKVAVLGIAPFIVPEEYMKRIVKIPNDVFVPKPSGDVYTTDKYSVDGVEYEVSPLFKEKVEGLMNKYRSYFDEK